MKTVVLQTFRTTNVPSWMQRCMASVCAWAELHGYDYEFVDGRIFDLCGADYLAQVGDNKRSITNLARLELIRLRLAALYERAAWLDADTFVFAPAAFRMDIDEGYAFSREVWVDRDEVGRVVIFDRVHNASCVFTRGQPDLDAGVDALVAVYHSDHRELCAHERDWPFRIINILEVVGESMGLHQHDRFKQLKVMQDADQIVAECRDLIAGHALDANTARDVVVKAMLGDQPLPLKGGAG
jgi:hypothetical protein